MRCFVCAGTHSSKLFEFEFECCTVRLGATRLENPSTTYSFAFPDFSFTFLLSLVSPPVSPFVPTASSPCSSLATGRLLLLSFSLSVSVFLFALLSLPPSFLTALVQSVFLSLGSRPNALSLYRVRFLEAPSLNPNPKVSVAFLDFDSCYLR